MSGSASKAPYTGPNQTELNVRKRILKHVGPAKIQISLRDHALFVYSLSPRWIEKDAKFLHANNEDSDQNARMNLPWAHMTEITFSRG